MLKISSLKFNLLISAVLLFVYNDIFLLKIFNKSNGALSFISFLLVVYLLMVIVTNLLFVKFSSKALAIFFIIFNTIGYYFMDIYNIAIDKIMFLNALETDKAEALDVLDLNILGYFLILAILPIILILKTQINYAKLSKEIIKRAITIVASIAIIAAIIVPNTKYAAQFLRNNKPVKNYFLPVNYIGATISTNKILKKRNHKLIKIGNDAKFTPFNNKKNVIVMVLGETARAANFSLGKYKNNTNQSLEKYKDDIIYFDNVSSCGTATAMSLPCIFSKYGREDFKAGSGAYTENVLDVIKKAGYDVIWRENNSGCKNNCDRIETQQFCTNYKCKDEILLKDIATQIKEKNNNILYVLHQQGSHGPAYYKRYPKEFAKFKPTCDTNKLEDCTKDEIRNTYDNSLLYTSYMLSQTIEKLKSLSDEYNVAMLYVSDHGESLGENELYLHSAPYAFAPDEQTHIPMLMWLDDNNVKNLNIDKTHLQNIKSNKLSHDNIFHTLLGLTRVQTKEYNKNLDFLHKD
ncbi:MAG: phosphoethanolamine--lipid A transferase [Alphaproteobacteria bacterium]